MVIKKFGAVRRSALDYWLQQTSREEVFYISEYSNGVTCDDFFENSLECQWQEKVREVKLDEDWHVSYFCSLGEWASNITDLLLDNRYDSLPLNGDHIEQEQKILFRYYTRVLLILSEMLTDFIQMYADFHQIETNGNEQDIRKKLSCGKLDVNEWITFINHVCKHKAKKNKGSIHQHNHHLPVWFDDANIPCPYTSIYSAHNVTGLIRSLKNSSDSTLVNGILMPSLLYMIEILLNCYKVLDNEFQLYPDKFNDFCTNYGKSVPD